MEDKRSNPFYRFIKVVFYLAYVATFLVTILVAWSIGEHRTCTLSPYDTVGTCYDAGSGWEAFGYAFLAGGIAWIVLEIIKALGIYIAKGTRFKDQHTLFSATIHDKEWKL